MIHDLDQKVDDVLEFSKTEMEQFQPYCLSPFMQNSKPRQGGLDKKTELIILIKSSVLESLLKWPILTQTGKVGSGKK